MSAAGTGGARGARRAEGGGTVRHPESRRDGAGPDAHRCQDRKRKGSRTTTRRRGRQTRAPAAGQPDATGLAAAPATARCRPRSGRDGGRTRTSAQSAEAAGDPSDRSSASTIFAAPPPFKWASAGKIFTRRKVSLRPRNGRPKSPRSTRLPDGGSHPIAKSRDDDAWREQGQASSAASTHARRGRWRIGNPSGSLRSDAARRESGSERRSATDPRAPSATPPDRAARAMPARNSRAAPDPTNRTGARRTALLIPSRLNARHAAAARDRTPPRRPPGHPRRRRATTAARSAGAAAGRPPRGPHHPPPRHRTRRGTEGGRRREHAAKRAARTKPKSPTWTLYSTRHNGGGREGGETEGGEKRGGARFGARTAMCGRGGRGGADAEKGGRGGRRTRPRSIPLCRARRVSAPASRARAARRVAAPFAEAHLWPLRARRPPSRAHSRRVSFRGSLPRRAGASPPETAARCRRATFPPLAPPPPPHASPAEGG